MLRIYLLWLCLVVVTGLEVKRKLSRLVVTEQGPVRGYSYDNGRVFTFYNIPYASAPTGPNKFKGPLPPPSWSEPFEAVDREIICPQGDAGRSYEEKNMQEDCLVANIRVPNTDQKNLPVVVDVHGGAFQVGYGDSLTANHLVAAKNIIVVNFNYRLGIHGFLCLGTEDAPGNAGMKDQLALLRWINRNIAYFGGNPDDVTLLGCSAGSASVDLLMLSKTTVGLFNKVITGSGSSISSFAVQMDPLETAKEHAKVLNFTNVNDLKALGEFYKTVRLDMLLLDTFRDKKHGGVTFAPCVESYVGVEMFLDDAPINILKTGNYRRMPVIYGFANMEGLFRLPYYEDWKNEMNENFIDFVPVDLQFRTEEEKKEVGQTIKEYFFGNQPVSDQNVLSYIDFFTDTLFAYSMVREAKIHVMNGHDMVYLYEFSYVDEHKETIPHTDVRGANHCDQNRLVMDETSAFHLDGILENVWSTKDIIRELWYNFIKTGKPGMEKPLLLSWPALNASMTPHMSFGKTVELKGPLLEERTKFWDKIYDRYYRIPVPPSRSNTKSNK